MLSAQTIFCNDCLNLKQSINQIKVREWENFTNDDDRNL
jgi:hypothetical protein